MFGMWNSYGSEINVIDVVWGVEMNGVKIKTVQKIKSNLLGAFGDSCLQIM